MLIVSLEGRKWMRIDLLRVARFWPDLNVSRPIPFTKNLLYKKED